MAIKAPVTMPTNDREFQKWLEQAYDLRLRFGTGSPQNVVVADRGTIYMRTDGGVGTTMYSKEADDGLSSGWEVK